MVLEPGGLIGWLMVGLIAGSLATLFMPGHSYGMRGDIGIGVFGAYVFGFAVSLGLPGPVGVPASILAALVGAVLLSRLARSVPGRSPA